MIDRRGPSTWATLGTQCCQSCWQAPPITNRSPWPTSHRCDAPPPTGRTRNGRAAPTLTMTTTGSSCSNRSRSLCQATESCPSRYRLKPIESNGLA